jgi:glycosyltransferase involved in cell wall biosynthesis
VFPLADLMACGSHQPEHCQDRVSPGRQAWTNNARAFDPAAFVKTPPAAPPAATRLPSKKRVLMLTQWFEPEPTFKGLVLARELVRRGYEVEVVTGFPNYPGGKLYPGHRITWMKRERIDGVEITRLPLYPSHDASALRRIANYGSFAASALLYTLFRARRPDVVYVYQLPTTGLVAAAMQLFRRTPFVYDVQDIWPDTLLATGMVGGGGVVYRAAGAVARWTYRHADGLVVNSTGFRRLLAERGVAPERTEVVLNWCDEQALLAPADTRPAFPDDGRFRIVFAGNMGLAQALDGVLDAAGLVRAADPRIDFVFIGSGIDAERLKAAAAARGLENVVFLPRVPIGEIGRFLSGADALLVHLKDDPLFAITIPAKTQAYMAIGKPVLMAAPGSAAELVREAGCGVEAAPQQPRSIADAALRLARLPAGELREMGERGRAYYDRHLAFPVGVARIAGMFERVTAAAGAR